eukprot:484235_1
MAQDAMKYRLLLKCVNDILSFTRSEISLHLWITTNEISLHGNDIYQFIQISKYHSHLQSIKKILKTPTFQCVIFNENTNSRPLWDILLKYYTKPVSIMNEYQINNWISQLLLAVKCLHERDMVHLDISPDSIVICNGPNGVLDDQVILRSFASAMFANNYVLYDINNELLRHSWQLPEIISKRSSFNGNKLKEFDMWTIGVLAGLLLTGTLPFQYNINKTNISNCAKDFIMKLLQNKMDCQEALKHDWMKGNHNNKYKINGAIFGKMYPHHTQKLQMKHSIKELQIKKHLRENDKQLLMKQMNDLDKQILNENVNKNNETKNDNDEIDLNKLDNNMKKKAKKMQKKINNTGFMDKIGVKMDNGVLKWFLKRKGKKLHYTEFWKAKRQVGIEAKTSETTTSRGTKRIQNNHRKKRSWIKITDENGNEVDMVICKFETCNDLSETDEYRLFNDMRGWRRHNDTKHKKKKKKNITKKQISK